MVCFPFKDLLIILCVGKVCCLKVGKKVHARSRDDLFAETEVFEAIMEQERILELLERKTRSLTLSDIDCMQEDKIKTKSIFVEDFNFIE